MSQPEYLFGDSDKAAQRLTLLARIYQESTRAFLVKTAGSAHFQLALDLGCGPGFTTHLIAEGLRCDRVIGLDASANFIKLACAAAGERVSFLEHDITAIPFPSGRANLIFSRFVLPICAIRISWWPNGRPNWNRTDFCCWRKPRTSTQFIPYLAATLAIVEAMLASQSNRLYAGHSVARLDSPGGLKGTFSELDSLPVRNCDAARMFVLNLNSWKQSEFPRTNYSPDLIVKLENDLTEIAANESSAREIEVEDAPIRLAQGLARLSEGLEPAQRICKRRCHRVTKIDLQHPHFIPTSRERHGGRC